MNPVTRSDYWSVVRVQQCDNKQGDKAGVWYCRIARTGGTRPSDILCDGTEPTLRNLCDQLNNLMPRLVDMLIAENAEHQWQQALSQSRKKPLNSVASS